MRDGLVTTIEINLDNLLHNYQLTKKHVQPAEVYAVVKSEAYGHGAVPTAQFLQEHGCQSFAVATVDEGIQLRNAGIEGNILIMGATLPDQFPLLADHELTPVVADLDRMKAWGGFARQRSERLPYHIKVDVGLGRMGLLPGRGEEAAETAYQLREHIDLVGVGSHLSYPGGGVQHNREEQERFEQFCAPFEQHFFHLKRHLAASQAAARFDDMHYEMVRIGGLLYGFRHFDPSPLDLRGVMTFRTEVAQVKTLPAGWWIGYGRKRKVTEPTRVALLPMGWTDGLTSYHMDSTELLVRGTPCPLVGVCTDFAMLDVSGVSEVKIGNEVILIGEQGGRTITPIQLGKGADISTGQLLGKLSIRVPRLYFLAGEYQQELSILNYR